MKQTIEVQRPGKSPSRVVIGDVINSLENYLPEGKRVVVIADEHVFHAYRPIIGAYDYCLIGLGETNKTLATAQKLYGELLALRADRSTFILGFGGGIVTDIAGFVASTYMRGLPFGFVASTLLAQVDSSVGGKTAIDLPAGKNLAGAFCQPSLVLCDTDTLNSLPLDIFRDGCAEVIKYGVLYDPKLFAHLEEKGLSFDREAVITRCVELKRDVVMEDEFDTGARMKLNLGHTVGHGVEAKSHFAISHGKAVAIGMAIVSRASACADTPRIVALLEQFGLPTRTDYSADDLFSYTLSDKKRSGGTVNLIIPRAIGDCVIVPTKVESLKSFIQAGL